VCVVDTPEIPQPTPQEQNKPLPIIRNPILDGLLGNIAATRAGTSAFRIDLVNPLTIPSGPGPGAGGGGGGGSGGGGSGGGGGTSGGSSDGEVIGTGTFTKFGGRG
jgi:hypothetical protein